MKIIIQVISIVFNLLTPSLLFAIDNDTAPSSSITISTGRDSDNNINRQIQLFKELSSYQQISAGYGESTSDTSLLNTTQQFVSIATDPYKTFSIGAEYSFWGKSRALETRALKSDLFVNINEWGFSFSPQLNVATFYSENGNSKFDLYSQGASFSANYYGLENYFFSANYYINRFSDDPFSLSDQAQKDLVIDRVSESAQLLMSGLEKYYTGASLGRFFDWGSVEISWAESKSAFVEGKNHTTSILLDYEVNKRLSLNIIAARLTSSTDSYSLNSVDIGLTVQW
ncbi:MAG: hypothetical protein OEM38_12275 [Gammaproteobacteria bacterium]|nr:hypothetical protein [Gammaproteobacteria bacterium]